VWRCFWLIYAVLLHVFAHYCACSRAGVRAVCVFFWRNRFAVCERESKVRTDVRVRHVCMCKIPPTHPKVATKHSPKLSTFEQNQVGSRSKVKSECFHNASQTSSEVQQIWTTPRSVLWRYCIRQLRSTSFDLATTVILNKTRQRWEEIQIPKHPSSEKQNLTFDSPDNKISYGTSSEQTLLRHQTNVSSTRNARQMWRAPDRWQGWKRRLPTQISKSPSAGRRFTYEGEGSIRRML